MTIKKLLFISIALTLILTVLKLTLFNVMAWFFVFLPIIMFVGFLMLLIIAVLVVLIQNIIETYKEQ